MEKFIAENGVEYTLTAKFNIYKQKMVGIITKKENHANVKFAERSYPLSTTKEAILADLRKDL